MRECQFRAGVEDDLMKPVVDEGRQHEALDGIEKLVELEACSQIFADGRIFADAFTHGSIAATSTKAIAATPDDSGPNGWRQ